MWYPCLVTRKLTITVGVTGWGVGVNDISVLPVSILSVDACGLLGICLDGHLLIIKWFICRERIGDAPQVPGAAVINWRNPSVGQDTLQSPGSLSCHCVQLLGEEIPQSRAVCKFVCLYRNRNGGEMLLGVCSSAHYPMGCFSKLMSMG